MLKHASDVKVGEYVLANGQYRGPVLQVEQTDDLTVISYDSGMHATRGQVEVREEQLVSGKLPRGWKIITERVDDGAEYVTLHNGRVIDKGHTSGTRSDARKLARTNLEAMGILTDE